MKLRRLLLELLFTLLCATVFANEAHGESLVPEVKIKLVVSYTNQSTHYECTLGKRAFLVPRDVVESGREFTITLPNGVEFVLPEMRHTCKEQSIKK